MHAPSPYEIVPYSKDGDRFVSAEVVGRAVGVSGSTITKHARDGVLIRREKGFHLEENVRLYVRHLERQAAWRACGLGEQ